MKGAYCEQSPAQFNLENKEHLCQNKSQVMPAGRLNYTSGMVWESLGPGDSLRETVGTKLFL